MDITESDDYSEIFLGKSVLSTKMSANFSSLYLCCIGRNIGNHERMYIFEAETTVSVITQAKLVLYYDFSFFKPKSRMMLRRVYCCDKMC